jgi:hypothetical protein
MRGAGVLKVKWVAGAAMLVCAGALVACEGAAEEAPTGASTPSGVVESTPSAAPPSTAAPSSSSPGVSDPVLSGKREVTIVRVQASESGVSLDNSALVEADDDSGRQLFVPTPLGGDKYLIKAYGKRDNHPASDEPACWQELNRGGAQALTVEGAVCDANNPRQRFTITAKGEGAYAISRESAFLQFSPSRGLILEELGDGPLLSTFRFVDNGPARRPAGG